MVINLEKKLCQIVFEKAPKANFLFFSAANTVKKVAKKSAVTGKKKNQRRRRRKKIVKRIVRGNHREKTKFAVKR